MIYTGKLKSIDVLLEDDTFDEEIDGDLWFEDDHCIYYDRRELFGKDIQVKDTSNYRADYEDENGNCYLKEWFVELNTKVYNEDSEEWEDKIIIGNKEYRDVSDVQLSDGDIIDIHQTVNGVNLFFVYYNKDVGDWEVKYYTPHCAYLHGNKYQYDVGSLLSPCKFSGEVEFEIIGKLKDYSKT